MCTGRRWDRSGGAVDLTVPATCLRSSAGRTRCARHPHPLDTFHGPCLHARTHIRGRAALRLAGWFVLDTVADVTTEHVTCNHDQVFATAPSVDT